MQALNKMPTIKEKRILTLIVVTWRFVSNSRISSNFFKSVDSQKYKDVRKIITERLTLWRLSRKVEVPTTWEI